MIVDSSALLSILFSEDDAHRYAMALATAENPRISAAGFLEAAIQVDLQAGPMGGRQLDALIERAGISVEPVTLEQVRIARQAYLDFGVGRHEAGLDFGHCFAYALAKTTGEPLLYKGSEFSRTDLRRPAGLVTEAPAREL
ncbi:MAG: type II toxin-antitoxin system VapC family toxin [Bryobacterales bacterium]|nr:type II toxin-antitoxin system VapC family toxin [Bryobacterales bacterium]